MNTDLSNKVAIITGAAGPQGSAVAAALAAVGVRVALSDVNPDRPAQQAAEIRARGGQAIDITADVANKFQCVNIIETTRTQWGQLDILVNAQHVRPSVSIIKMDEWEWMRCIDVNLKGTFLMSQLCGRVMSDENKERGGAIVNLAYDLDPAAEPTNAAFAAAMAGIGGFARECAREYAPYGIGVSTVLLNADGDATAVFNNGGSARPVPPGDLGALVVELCRGLRQPDH